jgi:tRNA(fMet)-specific endonuclease VapC
VLLWQKNRSIGAYNIQIATVDLSENMTLLSNNTCEFKRVNGLLLENWVMHL